MSCQPNVWDCVLRKSLSRPSCVSVSLSPCPLTTAHTHTLRLVVGRNTTGHAKEHACPIAVPRLNFVICFKCWLSLMPTELVRVQRHRGGGFLVFSVCWQSDMPFLLGHYLLLISLLRSLGRITKNLFMAVWGNRINIHLCRVFFLLNFYLFFLIFFFLLYRFHKQKEWTEW